MSSGHSTPPRLVPDMPFPAYAYLPGRTPHPTRDPEGHSFGAESRAPRPPDPGNWRACRDYLFGIDLFNRGYFWEAHEAWEGLWVACGREGPAATYFQALINLAAAGFKARWGSARGVAANAATALRLFRAFEGQLGPGRTRYMGLDVGELADYAATIASSRQAVTPGTSDRNPLVFGLVLRPQD
jgi:hypothetical protein